MQSEAAPVRLWVVAHGGPGKDFKVGVREFWHRVSSERWAQLHPALAGKSDVELERMLPVLYHTDGVEIFRNCEHMAIRRRMNLQ